MVTGTRSGNAVRNFILATLSMLFKSKPWKSHQKDDLVELTNLCLNQEK
jgi:hypothetical protein